MDAIVSAYLHQTRFASTAVKPALLYIDTPTHAHVLPSEIHVMASSWRQTASLWHRALHAIGLLKPPMWSSHGERCHTAALLMVGASPHPGPADAWCSTA